MIPSDRAAQAVRAIVHDIGERSGLREAWESVDRKVRGEIMTQWEIEIDHAFRIRDARDEE